MTQHDQFPPHCKTDEDRQLYRGILANLPSEEDLSLIATKPTSEWRAQQQRKHAALTLSDGRAIWSFTARRSKPLQFSLRTLFIVVLVSAICIFGWRLLVGLSFALFYPFSGVLLITGWWFGETLRLRSHDDESDRRRFSRGPIILAIVCVVWLASLWFRHRWVVWPWDNAWPRPFPYPDYLLFAYHEWLDSLFPAPPRMIKIHGEFYTGLIGLNAIALCLSIVVGALLGTVVRTNGPLGITCWRARITRLFQN